MTPNLPTIPVRLDDEHGHPRFVGQLLPLTAGPPPAALSHDRQLYVATGNVVGSGSTPTRAIYRRATPSVVVAAVPVFGALDEAFASMGAAHADAR